MRSAVDLANCARACASYAVHNGMPQEVLETGNDAPVRRKKLLTPALRNSFRAKQRQLETTGCFPELHHVRSAADDASMFPCSNEIAHNMRQKLFHVVPQQTQSFDRAVENLTLYTKFNLSVRTTRSRHCPRQLKLRVIKHV